MRSSSKKKKKLPLPLPGFRRFRAASDDGDDVLSYDDPHLDALSFHNPARSDGHSSSSIGESNLFDITKASPRRRRHMSGEDVKDSKNERVNDLEGRGSNIDGIRNEKGNIGNGNSNDERIHQLHQFTDNGTLNTTNNSRNIFPLEPANINDMNPCSIIQEYENPQNFVETNINETEPSKHHEATHLSSNKLWAAVPANEKRSKPHRLSDELFAFKKRIGDRVHGGHSGHFGSNFRSNSSGTRGRSIDDVADDDGSSLGGGFLSRSGRASSQDTILSEEESDSADAESSGLANSASKNMSRRSRSRMNRESRQRTASRDSRHMPRLFARARRRRIRRRHSSQSSSTSENVLNSMGGSSMVKEAREGDIGSVDDGFDGAATGGSSNSIFGEGRSASASVTAARRKRKGGLRSPVSAADRAAGAGNFDNIKLSSALRSTLFGKNNRFSGRSAHKDGDGGTDNDTYGHNPNSHSMRRRRSLSNGDIVQAPALSSGGSGWGNKSIDVHHKNGVGSTVNHMFDIAGSLLQSDRSMRTAVSSHTKASEKESLERDGSHGANMDHMDYNEPVVGHDDVVWPHHKRGARHLSVNDWLPTSALGAGYTSANKSESQQSTSGKSGKVIDTDNIQLNERVGREAAREAVRRRTMLNRAAMRRAVAKLSAARALDSRRGDTLMGFSVESVLDTLERQQDAWEKQLDDLETAVETLEISTSCVNDVLVNRVKTAIVPRMDDAKATCERVTQYVSDFPAEVRNNFESEVQGKIAESIEPMMRKVFTRLEAVEKRIKEDEEISNGKRNKGLEGWRQWLLRQWAVLRSIASWIVALVSSSFSSSFSSFSSQTDSPTFSSGSLSKSSSSSSLMDKNESISALVVSQNSRGRGWLGLLRSARLLSGCALFCLLATTMVITSVTVVLFVAIKYGQMLDDDSRQHLEV